MTIHNFFQFIKIFLIFYLIFIFLFSTIPYALNKEVSEEFKENWEIDKYYSDKVSGDRVQLVERTYDAFEARIRLINASVKTLDISCHTVRTGETTEQFFSEILAAADRGVKVRMVLDGKVHGLYKKNEKAIRYSLSNHPNIELKAYNEIDLIAPWKLNSLMHDKFTIVDNKFLLLGGRNVGDIYFNPKNHVGRVSEDRDVFIFNQEYKNENNKKSSIYQVKDYMDLLWNEKDNKIMFEKLSKKQVKIALKKEDELKEINKEFRKNRANLFFEIQDDLVIKNTVESFAVNLIYNPVHTNKKEPIVAYVLKELALNSKKSVLIQTPYSTANKKIMKAIEDVEDKNISVEMLSNSKGSTPNLPAFSNYYYNRQKFLNLGIDIFEYQGEKSLHTKTYMFDDNLVAIGSFNLDDRSMYIDTETMLIIDSPELQKIVMKEYDNYKSHSLKVDNQSNEYQENKNVEELPSTFSKNILLYLISIFSRSFEFLI